MKIQRKWENLHLPLASVKAIILGNRQALQTDHPRTTSQPFTLKNNALLAKSILHNLAFTRQQN